jgi:ribosomal protein L37AE/L43A
MTIITPRTRVTTAVLAPPDAPRVLACPMCHRPTSLSRDALAAGGDWRCDRCGQQWHAARLAASDAYAAWDVERDALLAGRDVAASSAAAPAAPPATRT